ncbi:iron ABC transporter substrate-binding protein [Oceanicella sp. SM1341]|uniref:iron ABC transporter substrate-binding protein n=1 Tax=Oceanicella sp. SM1341 TaxID=1548889 RepID=UPI000E525F3B|nr:iron ABC transporter substrate-binding protein [Oceanicella sp. SM1341]
MSRRHSGPRPDARRRALLRGATAAALGLAAPALLTRPAAARVVRDATGRSLELPDRPGKVLAAGPPAAVMLCVLAPEAMLGWPRAPRPQEKPFLPAGTADLPELGRLTGRGDTVNLERLLAAGPDLIIDVGSVSETYRSLAERVQDQTGIPYALIDGSFANTPAALRLLGEVLGRPERGQSLAAYAEETFAHVDHTLTRVPEAERPSVYLARGPEGLESAPRGSLNAEIIERVGGRNVVPEGPGRGLVTVSPEQVLAWAPDTIVTIDPVFAAEVANRPLWRDVPAVARGRVFLSPSRPFGFIDRPPAVNRLIGLRWLLHAFYPEQAGPDPTREVQDFYSLFYGVTPDAATLATLLGR